MRNRPAALRWDLPLAAGSACWGSVSSLTCPNWLAITRRGHDPGVLPARDVYPPAADFSRKGPFRPMILYPAIDLKQGAVVRLRRGEMREATVYNRDPADQARRFAES